MQTISNDNESTVPSNSEQSQTDDNKRFTYTVEDVSTLDILRFVLMISSEQT